MRSFLKFNRGVLRLPLQWRLWMMLLIAANMVVPLFFLGHLEAQVVLVALLLSLMLFTLLTAKAGFSRILGLGHLPWVPLVWFLATRLGEVPPDDFYGIWIRAVIALNATSLVIDAIDVIRYIAGDRKETVPGL
jgi:hypothetical protein